MKRLSTFAFIVSLAIQASSVRAGEATIKVNDQWRQTLETAQIALDRCIGGIMSRGDSTICREVQGFLSQLANLQTTPIPEPDKPLPPKP